MEEPLRILVIEQRRNGPGGLAELLLPIEDLDFGWEIAADVQELFRSASAFGPQVVLCSDYASAHAARSLLDSLRALCARPPTILISGVAEGDSTNSRHIVTQFMSGLGQEDDVLARSTSSTPTFDPQSADVLRGCFASLLEASASPIVLSDVEGWITYANLSACRVLSDAYEATLGTLLPTAGIPPRLQHWAHGACPLDADGDEGDAPKDGASARALSMPRLVRFDQISGAAMHMHIDSALSRMTLAGQGRQNSTLMFVAMSPGSSRIADELTDYSIESGADIAAGQSRTSSVPHGCCLRVTPHDFLFALPPPCSPVEAAFTAQRILQRVAEGCDAASSDISRAPSTGDPGASPREHRRDLRHTPPAAAASIGSRSGPIDLDLADALRRHAISVQYQPQFDLKTGRGCGVEALARWTLFTGECVPPSKFIPIAERSGMICDLGAWVLQSACEALARWCVRTPLMTMSVNVSAMQIGDEFSSALRQTLKQFHLRERQLELEITESALMVDADRSIECLKEWRRLGVRVAVDDFGSGYSSLDYLTHLPVDRLKLDPSLVRLMISNPKGAGLIRTILSLGSTLGIDVIAEGVETEDQLRMLTQLGCPGAQGYLLGRPMTATQAQIVLTKPWGNFERRPHAALPASRQAEHVH
jgi:EAL domain-containing protein (putative c-di-GMP-specific phosphodiesterase class I)/PAS domain-containing protein